MTGKILFHDATDVIVDEDIAAGRALFCSQGCNSCHDGAHWTIRVLSNVPGTLDVGIDSERDLRERFRAGHPAPQEKLPLLEDTQIKELFRFLRSIGPESDQLPIP